MKPRVFDSMIKARKWLAKHGRGRSLHLIILHDEWCTHGRSGSCNCNPGARIEELTVEALQRGEREQRKWLSRHERN